MIKHIDEDRLLEYALDIIEEQIEISEIEDHLRECRDCRERFEKIKNDMEVIGGLEIRRGSTRSTGSGGSRKLILAVLKAAALLIIGIGIGWSFSGGESRETVYITPCYVSLNPPDNMNGIAVSDALDMGGQYYRNDSI